MESLKASRGGRYTPRVTLAAIGLKINSLRQLDQIKQKVVILQKSLHHTPAQKLTDAFVAILAGAHGLNEISSRVQSDDECCFYFARNLGRRRALEVQRNLPQARD
jgi:hypothetical protein